MGNVRETVFRETCPRQLRSQRAKAGWKGGVGGGRGQEPWCSDPHVFLVSVWSDLLGFFGGSLAQEPALTPSMA